MRLLHLSRLSLPLLVLLVAQLIITSTAHLSRTPIEKTPTIRPCLAAAMAPQGSNFKILGPNKKPNPVVNETSNIMLTVVDANGQTVTGVTFESGSPDIASVDPNTGMVRGLQRGFATITARRGSESVSTFVVVARVSNGNGVKVPGDTKTDTGGRIYISDPIGNVIQRIDEFGAQPKIFAGQKGKSGKSGGQRLSALFSGPTAVAVDNRTEGGIYIADTLNHSIRKISFNDQNPNQVITVLGTGAPGINASDITPFAQAAFNGLRGIATDIGGNLFIADTDNNAIYYADFTKKQVQLLAGQPGVPGKADGIGKMAQFTRPVGIALSSDGRTIAVADTGNNRVRLITRDGDVTTLGAASSGNGVAMSKLWATDQATGEIEFDGPQSVSFDATGNIYVVDNSGVQVVTRVKDQVKQVVSLAQVDTFAQAASVVVRGTEAFVLDNNASSDAEAVKDVTVGAPEITSLSRDSDTLEGGSQVTITGKNFAPESLVVLGDSLVSDTTIVSATQISFHVPRQTAPGVRTLSVATRGGVAQHQFFITAKSFDALATGEITTAAGGVPFLGDSGIATAGRLNFPFISGLAIDSAGNLFIGDSGNNRVRLVNQSGVINTVAGNGNSAFNGDGIPALSAGLGTPAGVAIDGAGNLFITERLNQLVRRVDARTGTITIVAGTGDFNFSGDDGPAINATLAGPTSITVDKTGNLFIVDGENNRIRRVDAKTEIITTVAGNGKTDFSGDGGPATSAGLALGIGGSVVLDSAGNLFIADSNHNRIRRVDTTTGIITTVAGNAEIGSGGDGGRATDANLAFPISVAIDAADNLFIADMFNGRIRRVDAKTQIITTYAGNGLGSTGDGGPATAATLIPVTVAVDGFGNLFIADIGSNRIRRVDAITGIIDTFAGGSNSIGDGGPATKASLNVSDSFGVAVDTSGNIFIVNDGDNRVRRIDAGTGIITTVAGNGVKDFSGDNGPATSASLAAPKDLTLDRSGNLFITDTLNNRVRRVDARTGVITTVAGNGNFEFSGDGGPATTAGLYFPRGVAIDGSGNIFIADFGNSRIRRIDSSTGIITTFAGNGSDNFSGDGGPATNAGLTPYDVVVDEKGNLLIADQLNNRIRLVDTKGIINTVAGGGSSFEENIPATNAQLSGPSGLALDGAGNIFIAETFSQRIRLVDSQTGMIATIAGTGFTGFSGDGGPASAATFANPTGLALDKSGNLFIIDSGNSALRAIKGFAKGESSVTITSASFTKPNLVINGTGFGQSGAKVSVNGQEISQFIVSQADAQIRLKGSKKKLNLKKGRNQITVTVGKVTSNTFILNL